MSHTDQNVKYGPLGRSERKAATQGAIVDAAARLFARQGIAATSLDAIAAEVGLTKGAVYASFANKQAVVEAVEAHVRMNLATEPLFDASMPLQERLREVGRNLASAFTEVPRDLFLLDLEYYLDAYRNPEAGKRLRTRMRGMVTDAAKRLAGSVGSEELPLPPRELITAIGALGRGIMQTLLTDPDAITPKGIEHLFALLAVAPTKTRTRAGSRPAKPVGKRAPK